MKIQTDSAGEIELHENVTLDVIEDQCRVRHCTLDNPGVCIACGNVQSHGCEPDAREYECEKCGRSTLFAPEELAIMGAYYRD